MAPEMTVRRLLSSMGHRYRLHVDSLLGKPDMVFKGKRKIIFVHGCFWHQHSAPSCKISRKPKSSQEYWLPKLRRNIERDKRAVKTLKETGWRVLVIWECELKNIKTLMRKLHKFMN